MQGIYKFHVYCGRMGSLDGVFIADSELVAQAIEKGQEAYFYEVLGKHSEISVGLCNENITLVSQDEAVVRVIEEHDLCSGINPFEYLREDEDEEQDED
ncbi:hypothetical protein [Stenotrophomonas sp. UBA7606]|uniref:hypothetical protein n=1 Tax=Stenotrophomonas sp. UBA7606 TaxID=1947559 RepID=UPI0025F53F2B|nr:hypothetical protein [Stenotrophomonas sp. UBA7606]